jgi:hypothetical protein
MIKNNSNGFIWKLVVVYGTPYDKHKEEFIDELHWIMGSWTGPTLWGGISTLSGTKERRVMGL